MNKDKLFASSTYKITGKVFTYMITDNYGRWLKITSDLFPFTL